MKKALSILELQEKFTSGELSVEENTQKIISEAKNSNKEFHHFNEISWEKALQKSKELDKQLKARKASGKLFGIPVSVKDCLCVKGVESTAGSAILKTYKPLFNATAVERAEREGAIIIGKTSQDEFGFGTFSTNVGKGFQIPLNPYDKKRSCGGSSGGSAGFAALTENTHAGIAESTGGSIACPASFCGVFGFTPTYGRVSRYGLMDYASSLDKIGSMAKNTQDAALMLESIAGIDEKDSTSLPNPVEEYSKLLEKQPKELKIGIIKEFFSEGIDKKVSETVWKALKRLESEGAKLEEISLPLNAKYGIPAYYLVAMTESSTNLAKYCGLRYGNALNLEGSFDEYFTKVRTEFFGEEAKRRIILGTFARMSGFRDAYYLKAMKVRTLLIQEFQQAFKKAEILASPTMPIIAPEFSKIEKLSPLQNYAMDLCTVPANLAGLPHASINAGFEGKMPVGLMLTGNYLQELQLLQASRMIEKAVQ
ncbi:MAG: amidase family protein [Candidatus Diapherotrites archaeon]|nr:amidase family protein [Candidatus Diapherotrites archaeon]